MEESATVQQSYDKGKAMCKAAGMTLPILNTITKQKVWMKMSTENEFISSSDSFWLGLYSENENGVYQWDDGSPMDSGIVPMSTINKKCMRWNNGVWMSRPCDDTKKIICQGNSYLAFIIA